MGGTLLFSLSAMLSLAPAALRGNRGPARRDAQFWLLLAVALVGVGAWTVIQAADGWRTGFAAALWMTITVSLVVYGILAAVLEHAWRLSGLLTAYLLVLAAGATIWSQAPQHPLAVEAPSFWLLLHVGASVLTYALLTIGAIAGVAVLIQERAFKRKRRGPLVERLPSMADCERLEVGLIVAAEIVLGIGIVTGMAIEFMASGSLITFDHKTIFILSAFAVIGALVAAHFLVGVRGRRAARFVLLGYLLVTLGYPGVKFVSDVLLG
jgi:ABC-type uncharacterized transport system permease subunit